MKSWKLFLSVVAVVVASNHWHAPAVRSEPLAEQLHSEAQTARSRRGLPRQQLDAGLSEMCQRHAQWMASRERMAHGSGENIVAYGGRTPADAIAIWMGSAPHRAFVLGGSSLAGWGAAQSRSGTWFWAGAFRGTSRTPEQLKPIDDDRRRWLFRRRR